MNYKARYYVNPDMPQMHTIRDFLRRAKRLAPDWIAYRQYESRVLESAISYRGLSDNVDALGTAMLAHGLQGAHIALLGESSVEWITSYFAVINGVGVAVPLDRELGDETLAHQLRFGDISAVCCSAKCMKKLMRILPNCPNVKTVILLRAEDEVPGCQTLPYAQLLSEGRKLLLTGDKSYVDATIDVDALAQIIYTSGTTGANKGVMHSQRNIMSCCDGAAQLVKFHSKTLSVLPINHTYELTCTYIASIYELTTVCINDDLKHVLQNLDHFSPKMSLMVPMMLDLMARKIRAETAKNGLTKHMEYGIRFSNFLRKFGIDQRQKYFRPVLSKFGGRFNKVICGGAPLSQSTADFLDSLGITVHNGYGITECAPLVAVNGDKLMRRGSVGHVLPTCQVRISNPDENGNGEIQVHGGNVMLGYYKAPEDTAAVFTEDGWLKTGDLGHMDHDRFLFINGRVKNLIILSNGKNVYPEEVEEHLQAAIPYLEECVVFADQDNTGIYAVCYLNPDYCKENGLDTIQKKYEHVMKDVTRYNQKSETFKRITNVQISESEFAKTTTKKIKRFEVERKMQNV